MENVHTRSYIGRDGILKVEIQTTFSETDMDVFVIYQPIKPSATRVVEKRGWPPGFFEETAGQWQ